MSLAALTPAALVSVDSCCFFSLRAASRFNLRALEVPMMQQEVDGGYAAAKLRVDDGKRKRLS